MHAWGRSTSLRVSSRRQLISQGESRLKKLNQNIFILRARCTQHTLKQDRSFSGYARRNKSSREVNIYSARPFVGHIRNWPLAHKRAKEKMHGRFSNKHTGMLALCVCSGFCRIKFQRKYTSINRRRQRRDTPSAKERERARSSVSFPPFIRI